ncbi:MAG: hypothetical protein ACOYMG_19445 [Candidatus Methylumidiphilus sp.]
MSALKRLPEADPLFAGQVPDRPFYATGMLLDAQDFVDEQTYHRSRLARALAFGLGSGTLAGLRVSHQPGDAKSPEEIIVAPGVAVDRLGRMIEIPRPACLRLGRWFDGKIAAGGGDALRLARYDNLARFLSARSQAGNAGEIPALAVVADVFVRFIACEKGLTPSFAAGPFDALDAVSTSRLRDAYELLLIERIDLKDTHKGLPDAKPDLAAIADPAARLAALQDAVLDAWPTASKDGLSLLPEHPPSIEDPTAVFIGRVLIPVTADNPPQRDGAAVWVDNWPRRFLPPLNLVAHWLGA